MSAGDTFDGIIFGGDFDPSGIIAGVEKLQNSVKSLEKHEGDLKNKLAETEKQYNQNKTALESIFKQQQQLKKSEDEYLGRMKALTKQADELRQKNIQLSNTVSDQKKQLEAAAQSVVKMKAAYDGARQSVENFKKSGENIGDHISGNKFFGKLSEMKGKVKETFVSEIPNAIKGGGIESALTSMGASFGIWGSVVTAAITPVVLKMLEVSEANKQWAKIGTDLKEVRELGLKNSTEEISQLNILYTATQNTTLSLKERKKAVEALQEKYPSYFGNLSQEAILAGNAAAAYEKLTQAILKRGLADAAKERIQEISGEILDASIKVSEADVRIKAIEKQGVAVRTGRVAPSNQVKLSSGNIVDTRGFTISQNEGDISAAVSRIKTQYKDAYDVVAAGQARIKKITDAVGPENLIAAVIGDDTGKTGKESKTKKRVQKETSNIVNIYQQELQKLRADIAAANRDAFTNDATITQAVEEEFKARALAFDKAVKNKQLTKGQAENLKKQLGDLQDLVLKNKLTDFEEKKAAFLSRINDELSSASLDASQKNLSLLQNDFERERQLIQQESLKTETLIIKRRDKLISDIKKDGAKNGLNPEQIQAQIDEAIKEFDALFAANERVTAAKNQQLAFDTFEKLSEEAKRVLESGNLGVSEASVIQIQEQTKLLQQGKITYQQYQKELTKIARFEARERLQLERLFLEAEIKTRQEKLRIDESLTQAQIKRLNDEITQLRQRLANVKTQEAQTAAETKNRQDPSGFFQFSDSSKEQLNKLSQYANAVNTLTQSIISFWQQSNEAEQRALDRSITLQQKRVDSARVLAERGNAEYLRIEEDRLRDLEVKRENAARRQMAINAALQASQIITALISSIAQGAQVGGALGAIISLAGVVGAITSGIALAKSLQPDQPSFFVGTEDTGTGGKVDNKGGFHAILHPHERVIPEEHNKKLRGVSNEDLVKMVEANRKMVQEKYASKPLPQLNLAAMERAVNISTTLAVQSSAIEAKLEESNRLQQQTNHLLKNLSIIFNVDKDGLAASVSTAIEEIKKQKKI